MLLGHKKTQGDEKNWSIILNPLRNELDKKRVSQKISEAFSLSQDEASDLVANTPIILLDNLTKDDAVRVKKYFQPTGAEIMLTNDLFLKRKCYRTVWPDTPTLSFLEEWKEVKPEHHEEMMTQELAVEEALQEIQSLGPSLMNKPAAPVEKKEPAPSFPQGDRDQLMREADRWKRECNSYQAEATRLRQELDHARRELEKTQKERVVMERTHTSQDDLAHRREKELQDLQALLSNAEEKYEGLKEEYRQTRVLMNDKLNQANRRTEEETAKSTQIQQQAKAVEKAKLILEESVKQLSLQNSDALSRVNAFDKTRQELEETLRLQNEKYQTLEREYHDVHSLLERKLSGLSSELASGKAKIEELEEKIQGFESERRLFEVQMKEQEAQADSWREKYETLMREAEILKISVHEEKSQRVKMEERFKDFEKSLSLMNKELDERSREARQWELRALDLEKELSESRHAYEEQLRTFEGKVKLLETKDRELESLRRQVREINQQIEQREAVQKRMHLMSQLTEKEAQLKKLVGDQEKIESEIRSREESMRTILAEQEALEKEIIEAKQTERHLMEQIKKDKTPRFSALGGPASSGKVANGKTDAAVFHSASDGEVE
ncbi:MAG: hypothetical protein HYZ84_05090 [Candidatus Omnitrophica bacterium]|nr:hypothetical protein [Candidatus Omnitrophota bacterium]